MIYGCFSKSVIGNNVKIELQALENLMHFEGYEIQKLKVPGFRFGYYNCLIFKKVLSEYFFHEESNGCCVIISGNIYNRSFLEIFINANDTSIPLPQLIYRIYKKVGREFVNCINGDFVIVIYDPQNDTFLLFRDQLGIHPLAYTFQEKAFIFSFDLISLCRIFHKEERLDSEYLAKNFKMIDFNRLPNPNVKKLLPGHFIELTSKGFQIKKYWFPEKIKINKSLNRQQMISEMKVLVEKAVKIRGGKNTVAASHLSGGLDSGIVAAMARRNYSKQNIFYGFSWSSEKDAELHLDFDERNLVLDQCSLNNIEPVFITLNRSDFLKYIKYPLRNSNFFAENKVLEEAKKRNISIVFSGYGGDEFISIGNNGIDSDLFLNFKWKSFFSRYPVFHFKMFLSTLLYEVVMPFVGILSFPVKKTINMETKYLKAPYRKPNKNSIRKFYFYKSRRQVHLGYLYCYYLPDRIENWYVNGVRAGVQYRYPLLDKDIIEYMLKIPSKFLFNGDYTRIILREISEGVLPESVRWKKSGLDPALNYFAKKNVINCSLNFINDIEEIKKNLDLDFIDFKKIEEDIVKFNKSKEIELFEDLLFAIFDIKQLHEFTKSYRNIN